MYTIMIIDDNETELLVAKKALERQYRIIDINSPKAALQRLAKSTIMPDFILLDIAMPGVNGFDFIMRLKTNEKTKGIPVLFLSGDKENTTEMEAYRLGGVDFIRKPIIPDLLRKRLELQANILDYKSQMDSYNNQLQQTASFQARNAMNLEYFIIGIITDLISQKDPYTGMHSICVSKYMEILLKEMLLSGVNYGIDPNDFELILLSSRLHDMGKIGVPDAVLTKTGKYTDEEFALMKAHTTMAANAIQKYAYLLPNNKFLYYTFQMAKYHHERVDGNGYYKLQGDQIPLASRLMAVADTFSAITMARSYKPSYASEEAVSELKLVAGTQLDAKLVDIFCNIPMNRITACMEDVKKRMERYSDERFRED